MKRIAWKTNSALAVVIAAILTAGQAVADKPSWAGGGKSDRNERSEHGDRNDKVEKGERNERPENNRSRQPDGDGRSSYDRGRSSERAREHFSDRHRTIANDYYREQFQHGRCPPGLAKKNNGCMPPGQAKRWSVGRALPRDVIYYDVPSALVVQFDPPSTGYRYVRVASDILLIALGTGMVVDAIQDLGRM